MYVTTEAVESFVEEHYGDQIARCSIAYGHRLMFFDTSYLYMRLDASQKSTDKLLFYIVFRIQECLYLI